MRYWSEGKAAAAAIMTSAAVLSATFGFAGLMRKPQAARSAPEPVKPNHGFITATLTIDPANGRKLFLLNCAHCHGDDARGDEGPNLYDLRKSDDRIHTIITAGIKGEMPSFVKKLGDDDIRSLTAYLRTLKS